MEGALDPVGMLPSGLVLRKEREDLPALVAAQPTEERARAVVEAHNARTWGVGVNERGEAWARERGKRQPLWRTLGVAVEARLEPSEP